MERKVITVDGYEVTVPVPLSLKELRKLVADDNDILYLAYRKWEQSLRSYLLNHADEGQGSLQDRADDYQYHRGRRR